jgi:hypothetical protein
MKTRNKVKTLTNQGKSTEEIMNILGITRSSLGSYRAHLTRIDQANSFGKLEHYMTSTYVVIPTENILEKLNPEQVVPFVEILDTLFGNSSLEKKIKETNGKNNHELEQLPESIAREVVIEYKNKGLSYEDILKDPRIKGVFSNESIRAYLAHYGRDTYNKGRMEITK